MNRVFSARIGSIAALLLCIKQPAMEKALSDLAVVAGILKITLATAAIFGNDISFVRQKLKKKWRNLFLLREHCLFCFQCAIFMWYINVFFNTFFLRDLASELAMVVFALLLKSTASCMFICLDCATAYITSTFVYPLKKNQFKSQQKKKKIRATCS